MKITDLITIEALLGELGSRLRGVRLERNITQAVLAKMAGVGKVTVERLEKGSVAVQLSSFLRVCLSLGLADRLDYLLPEFKPGPVMLMQMHGKARKRASGKRKPDSSSTPWTWGDEYSREPQADRGNHHSGQSTAANRRPDRSDRPPT